MDKIPIQFNKLWDAFKNVAIVLSFIFNIIALCAIIVLLDLLFFRLPQLQRTVIRPKAQEVQQIITDAEEATISLTVPISETIPVKFTLPVRARTTARTTAPVPLSTGANFVLPGGGGTIRGTVNLVLPQGMQLPVELYIEVPVSQTVPIQMEVPVSIKLKNTELGTIIKELKQLLGPLIGLLTK